MITTIDEMTAAIEAAAAQGAIKSLRLGKAEFDLYSQMLFIERRTKPAEERVGLYPPELMEDESHFEPVFGS